jgi:hypothetical protein
MNLTTATISPSRKRSSAGALAACLFAFSFFLAAAAGAAGTPEAQVKVLKVLPQFIDKFGRHTISPSLYERDAYQFYLRKHPGERAGLRLAVQWKGQGISDRELTLRAELRGVTGNILRSKTIETPVKKKGWFSTWSEARLDGEEFQDFGELVSWRVSILDGGRPLGWQESFLWSGVVPRKQ